MWLDSLADDAAGSLKRIRRRPRNFLLLFFMLAVSTGSVTSIFDIAYKVLFRSLPYAQIDRIAITTDDDRTLLFSPYTYQPNPRLDAVFEKAAAYNYLSANLSSESGLPPRRIQLAMVTWQFFSTLGVSIPMGRDFSEAMQPPPSSNGSLPSWLPIILSDSVWRSQFGASDDIVGRYLTLNTRPYRFQIIGVAPPQATFPPGADAWTPEFWPPYLETASISSSAGGGVIGVLRPGVSLAAAQAMIRSWPQNTRFWFNWIDPGAERLIPLRQFLGGNLYRLGPVLWLLTVLFTVLASAAAISLVQVDADARAKEVRIRKILGATPARLFRCFSIEMGLALLLGLVASFPVRIIVIHWTEAYVHPDIAFPAALSWIDLLLAASVAVTIFVVSAIVQSRRFQGTSNLAPGSPSRFRFPAQVIPAVVIMITAAMLGRSAYRLMRTDPGVQSHNAFVCEIALRLDTDQPLLAIDQKLPKAERQKQGEAAYKKFKQQLVVDFMSIAQGLRHESGVTGVGAITVTPYNGHQSNFSMYSYYSRTLATPPASDFIDYTLERSLTPGAIQALGFKLIYGRDLSENAGAEDSSVLVNEALAAHLGGPAALGQYIRMGSPQLPPSRIIGVIENTHEKDLYSPAEPTVYYSFNYRPLPDVDIVVRTSGKVPNQTLFSLIQKNVKSIAPDATVSYFSPLTDLVESGTQWTKYSAYFLLSLAVLGVFLAGICAWAKAVSETNRREHEIGVRLALGAAPRQIVRMIVGTHVILTLLAALIGAVFTLWFAHFMSYLFYQITPLDPLSYAIGIGAITLYVAIVVAWSVSRASRRSPQGLLRAEPFV